VSCLTSSCTVFNKFFEILEVLQDGELYRTSKSTIFTEEFYIVCEPKCIEGVLTYKRNGDIGKRPDKYHNDGEPSKRSRFVWHYRDSWSWSDCDWFLLYLPGGMRSSHPTATIKQQTQLVKSPSERNRECRRGVSGPDMWCIGCRGTALVWRSNPFSTPVPAFQTDVLDTWRLWDKTKLGFQLM